MYKSTTEVHSENLPFVCLDGRNGDGQLCAAAPSSLNWSPAHAGACASLCSPRHRPGDARAPPLRPPLVPLRQAGGQLAARARARHAAQPAVAGARREPCFAEDGHVGRKGRHCTHPRRSSRPRSHPLRRRGAHSDPRRRVQSSRCSSRCSSREWEHRSDGEAVACARDSWRCRLPHTPPPAPSAHPLAPESKPESKRVQRSAASFSTQTTHFSHLSHTPFPHISECELFLKESSQRGSRLVVMGGSSAYGMRGGRVAARGEWEMGQSSRLIRPQRCSKDTAVLFLDWAGASLAIRIVSRHFFLKSPLFSCGLTFWAQPRRLALCVVGC